MRTKRWLASAALALSGCVIGPKYQAPDVGVSKPAYKEAAGWSGAKPEDSAPKGPFWEVYGDPTLDRLEREAERGNQQVVAAYQAFVAARALVRGADARYWPTLALDPGIQTGGGQAPVAGLGRGGAASPPSGGRYTQYTVPLDASWAPDLWGKLRNTLDEAVAKAQLSAADLENQKLLMHAELAADYFKLRAQDRLQQLLDATVRADAEALKLAEALHGTGLASDEAVVQAEAQVATARAEAVDLGILRAQYEHALALLVGKAPADFQLAPAALLQAPPAIPLAVPSQLLERRPDIASAERAVAAANAAIGLAMAAYYPDLTLTGSAGIGGNSVVGLSKAPELFWSVGAALAETLFDGGARAATEAGARAAYARTVALYRQQVLAAFGQVEDALAGLRVLEREAKEQADAVSLAQRAADLALSRFRLGLDPYLNVITAQTALLAAQRSEVTVMMQRYTTSVQLIEAMGGGWQRDTLPTKDQLESH